MSDALTRGGATLQPVSFEHLKGWNDVDHVDAWATFRSSAIHIAEQAKELRASLQPSDALRFLCGEASGQPARLGRRDARLFFEQSFQAYKVRGAANDQGFITGYYEPVVEGARQRSAAFTAPILPRPDDLETFAAGARPSGIPAGYAAGRRGAAGLEIYPDRAALEAFALSDAARPVVWLRDWTEVFLIQVQGSARVRLTDGSEHRLVYAGRNGHPYTSIGRRLIEAGQIAEAEMSLAVLKDWLRRHGQEVGQAARALMQDNRSYIFFRLEPVEALNHGPIGGQGLPLRALSSIAVDRDVWSYGLPFWLESDAPVPGFGPAPMARLFVAQDTGSAIVGPARADLFMGSGDEAGAQAGGIRHATAFTVLLPRSA